MLSRRQFDELKAQGALKYSVWSEQDDKDVAPLSAFTDDFVANWPQGRVYTPHGNYTVPFASIDWYQSRNVRRSLVQLETVRHACWLDWCSGINPSQCEKTNGSTWFANIKRTKTTTQLLMGMLNYLPDLELAASLKRRLEDDKIGNYRMLASFIVCMAQGHSVYEGFDLNKELVYLSWYIPATYVCADESN